MNTNPTTLQLLLYAAASVLLPYVAAVALLAIGQP
jgi:hypothetical protein